MLKISLWWLSSLLGLACIQASSGCSSAGGTTPQAGAGTSSAGDQATSGTGPGAAGTAGHATGGTPSGGAAQGGSAPSAGAGGAATGGASGAGGSSNVNPGKGASGKAVCTGLSGFVDPTTGMGAVKEVTAPQDGSFFAFLEGTVWVATTKQLLFSDNAGSPERIWSFDPTSMMLTKVLEDSGSNGLAVDSNDQIIVADQKNHAIYRWDSETKMKVGDNIASGSFKPNDVVVRSDGGIYITDPDSGLYYIAPGSSEAMKASTKVNRPNGIVLTLDEKALIVGDVGNQSLSKFELGADGSVIDMTTPFAMTTGTTADGMCEDCAGNVYVSTQTGVEIFDASGKRLGVVPTGESSNCTFGGMDRKTLFVASRATLKVVTMANAGLPD